MTDAVKSKQETRFGGGSAYRFAESRHERRWDHRISIIRAGVHRRAK
jgi:hypothetical protein